MKTLVFGALTLSLCKGSNGGMTVMFQNPETLPMMERVRMFMDLIGERVKITLSELEGWTTLVTDFKSVEDVKSLLDEDESTRQVA